MWTGQVVVGMLVVVGSAWGDDNDMRRIINMKIGC